MSNQPDRFPDETHLDTCDAHYLGAWLDAIEPDPLPPEGVPVHLLGLLPSENSQPTQIEEER